MRLRIATRETGSGSIALVQNPNSDLKRKEPPPVHYGRRATFGLSVRGARAIREAAHMAVLKSTPLRAFYTFTVDALHRPAILDGTDTMGAHMRDFLRHLRQRAGGELPYVWVAETPLNAHGEPNPHVHMLTSYTVPRSDFLDFAAWCESRWGIGFVHIERIKFPEAAGRYMLKAIDYVGKGAHLKEDSPVWGRRFSVSACLRPAEVVEYVDLNGPRALSNVCEIFGGTPRPYGSGYFTGHGIVYKVGTGVADIERDAVRLRRYGAAVVYGPNPEGEVTA